MDELTHIDSEMSTEATPTLESRVENLGCKDDRAAAEIATNLDEIDNIESKEKTTGEDKPDYESKEEISFKLLALTSTEFDRENFLKGCKWSAWSLHSLCLFNSSYNLDSLKGHPMGHVLCVVVTMQYCVYSI